MSAFGTYGFPAGNLAYEPPRSGFTYSFLAVAATQTVRIPLGVSWGRASVIGAGGTGGTQAGANASALIGGGGGGGYAQATIFVIPGQIYTLTGGAAPAGTSSFGSLVSATGGATATTSTGGAGGVGFAPEVSGLHHARRGAQVHRLPGLCGELSAATRHWLFDGLAR